MTKFNVGDKVKVMDRLGWPNGYKIANMIGTVVEVKQSPPGYVIIKAEKTGFNMAFHEIELEKAS